MYYDFSVLDETFGVAPTSPEPVWIDEESCVPLTHGWQEGEKNFFYGYKHTEESKQSMSENRPDYSGENNPRYGVKLSQQQIEKFRKSKCKHKHIFTRPDGSQFVDISISDVAKKNGLQHPNLYRVLKGKNKQHKGWKVEYYE